MEIIESIKKAGMSEYEAKAYYALLFLGEGTSREVSNEAHVPITRVFDVLEGLEEKNLIQKMNDNPKVWKAIGPEVGLKGFIETKVEGYKQLEEYLISNLKLVKPEVKHEVRSKVILVSGFTNVFRTAADHIEKSWKSLDIISVGERLPVKMEVESARAIKRGVDIRMICTKYDSTNADMLKKWIRDGWKIRHAEESQEYSLGVFDERACIIIIKAPKNDKDRIGVVFENESLSKSLHGYFKTLWETANPIKTG
ncbi:MAG: helix-turn-helix domain-containing protein [Candidatus Micrarchaeales archaeon]